MNHKHKLYFKRPHGGSDTFTSDCFEFGPGFTLWLCARLIEEIFPVVQSKLEIAVTIRPNSGAGWQRVDISCNKDNRAQWQIITNEGEIVAGLFQRGTEYYLRHRVLNIGLDPMSRFYPARMFVKVESKTTYARVRADRDRRRMGSTGISPITTQQGAIT